MSFLYNLKNRNNKKNIYKQELNCEKSIFLLGKEYLLILYNLISTLQNFVNVKNLKKHILSGSLKGII